MITDNRAERKRYWSEFYKRKRSLVPSQFCVLVASEIDSRATVVDCGSGNGRDSLFFAAQGHHTIAMDLSIEALKTGDHEAKQRGLHDRVRFLPGDLSSRADVENAVQIARSRSGSHSLVFYCRFVLHSLDDTEENRFLRNVAECMNPNEYVFFEFRTREDVNRKKHYPDHFRRYLDTENFERKLEEHARFVVEYSVTGVGMAKFKEEDPVVSRVFAKRAECRFK